MTVKPLVWLALRRARQLLGPWSSSSAATTSAVEDALIWLQKAGMRDACLSDAELKVWRQKAIPFMTTVSFTHSLAHLDGRG